MTGKRTTKRTKAAKPQVEASAAATGKEDALPVVQLPADCRLAAQAVLKAQLEEVLHGGEIVLDVEGLERVDTAALQLLVLFRRELESQGGVLRWRGANAVLSEAAGLLGLEQLLNLPAATLA
jgi:anti-anti-sigma regulatory factor